MLMTLNLLRNERETLVISEQAVVSRGESTFVMVMDMEAEPHIAERRRVTLGTRTPGKVEVLSNLAAGEMIITHGSLKVRPGSAVRIRAIDDGTRPIADLIRAEPDGGPG
jgi:membrane fusion protein (multidrug efflux system)